MRLLFKVDRMTATSVTWKSLCVTVQVIYGTFVLIIGFFGFCSFSRRRKWSVPILISVLVLASISTFWVPMADVPYPKRYLISLVLTMFLWKKIYIGNVKFLNRIILILSSSLNYNLHWKVNKLLSFAKNNNFYFAFGKFHSCCLFSRPITALII